MGKRFPKRGFRIRRFNTDKMLEKINLGKIAYYIEKGMLDPRETITIKHLYEVGALSKITHGVHVLGRGSSRIQAFGIPINLEVTDASERVVRAIKSTGGSLKSEYRTELIMRHYLKPHKFAPHQETLKTPMPPQKTIKKLEKIRAKGIEVNYPMTPWFDNNKERLAKEKEEQQKRIANAQHAALLPQLPADRSKGVGKDKPRVQREQLFRKVKLQ
uniref:Large ribosomal subunit protein uL15/eL18 domain-containing protein n=1 Tax=Strombidium inclinatum TaxID=197538 RepID=A0A7S3MZV7_9SPIT|mmetsp:Transcript_42235/g.64747  ORF Transcript_42235/g.64747 Transcript_42235/m.64747 type:complete len:216 (+) Transcript_42235:308-955(+)